MNKDFSKQRDQRLIVNERGKTQFIDIIEITHLTCEAYLTTIHTIKGKQITVTKLLKEFEKELVDFGFFRVNRNTLINMKYIASMKTRNKPSIELLNNCEIFVSCRRLSQFKKALAL